MRKFLSFMMIAAGLMTVMTVKAVPAATEKFYVDLTSGNQALSLTVNSDYEATVVLPDSTKFASTKSFTMNMRMTDMMGMSGTHSTSSTVKLGDSEGQVNLSTWMKSAYQFNSCTLKMAVKKANGEVDTLTYNVFKTGGIKDIIYATPEDKALAAEAWAQIANKLTKSDQISSDNYVKFAANSFVQYGDEIMTYGEMTLFKGETWTINGTLSKLAAGVVTPSGENGKSKIVLKAGSQLAFGYKVATFDEDLIVLINTGNHTGELTKLHNVMDQINHGASAKDVAINTFKTVAALADTIVKESDGKVVTGAAGTIEMKQYVRNTTIGKYGTICLQYAPLSITGADFFKPGDYANKNLEIDPVAIDSVKAGVPYFFQATATQLVWSYAADADSVALEENNGLVGVYERYDVTTEAEEVYMLSNNLIRKALPGSWLDANRAYIKLSKIEPQPSAPGRRTISVEQQIITDIEEAEMMENDGKYIIDGEIVIIRGGVRYNVFGARL